MRQWRVSIPSVSMPRIRMPFPKSSKKNKEDPVDREFVEFTKGLLLEMHQENMRLLRQSLEEIRDRRQQRKSQQIWEE